MKLPTKQECLDMFSEYLVPECIYRHCRKVSQVGIALAIALKRHGVQVDAPLVEIGCLLHDMMKLYSLDSLEPRLDVGYPGPTNEELLLWKKLRRRFQGLHETIILSQVVESKYPELAHFISRIGSTGNPTYFDGPIELKIIHYVDWRVENDYLVLFSERLDYLGKTYRHKWQERGPSWWDQMLQSEFALECELLDPLGISPEDFVQKLAVHHIDIRQSDPEKLAQAVLCALDALKNGGLIVYPAKNGYMIGANPFDAWAVDKVYRSKRRPREQFLACIVSNIEMAQEYTSLTEKEKVVVQALMPGPTLLIGRKTPKIPDWLSREGFAFTIARTEIAKALVEQMRQPLVATSCNISGNSAYLCVDDIDSHILNYVDVVFDVGELPYQPDYTVAKFENGSFITKREGIIDTQDIQNVLDTLSAGAAPDDNSSLVRDRITFLEKLLAVTTLDCRVAQLWLGSRFLSHSSDLDIIVVVSPEELEQVYREQRGHFSRRGNVILSEEPVLLKFGLESGLEVTLNYVCVGAELAVNMVQYRLLWSPTKLYECSP